MTAALDPLFRQALVSGHERLGAWAELLDRINVFPVADGDTGRNLTASFAPLRRTDLAPADLTSALLFSARGNSGNIGARFLQSFLEEEPDAGGPPTLVARCRRGGALARRAVSDPKPGTMLSFFEALELGLARHAVEQQPAALAGLLDELEAAVRGTTAQLPKLAAAGVVDSGALGMYLFFEGFLAKLVGCPPDTLRDVGQRFADMLAFSGGNGQVGAPPADESFCVDVVLRSGPRASGDLDWLSGLGDEVVAIRHGDCLKLHLHAGDPARLRRELEKQGRILHWSTDDLVAQTRQFARPAAAPAPIHVLTDAAGSLTREDAQELGLTLLDSYVQLDQLCLPETCLQPADLYAAMRRGAKVSTSQASVSERHLHYHKTLSLHRRALYLCVGSCFTGNFTVASQWQRQHDPEGRLSLLDTGAASGRLGVIARATARFARTAPDADAVLAFARAAVEASREYIFLDRLHWLAAGGRLSKTSAFFGDLLQMKPVVSPTAEGAKKVGMVRRDRDQLEFALARLAECLTPSSRGLILLEYSDNEDWLVRELLGRVRASWPAAEVLLRPFSLTSGAHMGPGTWAVAMLPTLPPGDDGRAPGRDDQRGGLA